MDLHNAQKERLKDMQKELVRQDKQHLREQLQTIKKVQSICNTSKKNRDVLAYMQSTNKESSFNLDEDGSERAKNSEREKGQI